MYFDMDFLLLSISFTNNFYGLLYIHETYLYLGRDLGATILSSILFSMLKMCFRCQPLRRQVL